MIEHTLRKLTYRSPQEGAEGVRTLVTLEKNVQTIVFKAKLVICTV